MIVGVGSKAQPSCNVRLAVNRSRQTKLLLQRAWLNTIRCTKELQTCLIATRKMDRVTRPLDQ
jgi:hypothetical protein